MEISSRSHLLYQSRNRFSSVFVTSIASGLPLLLCSQTLQAWFVDSGVDLIGVGALSMVGIPYTLKIFWAPMMDNWHLFGSDQRRSWLILLQVFLLSMLLVLVFISPKSHAGIVSVVGLLIAFFSASQDVVVDGYRVDILKPVERGLGASVQLVGYRLGMLISGSLAIVIAGHWGWSICYLSMAFFLALILLYVIFSLVPSGQYAACKKVDFAKNREKKKHSSVVTLIVCLLAAFALLHNASLNSVLVEALHGYTAQSHTIIDMILFSLIVALIVGGLLIIKNIKNTSFKSSNLKRSSWSAPYQNLISHQNILLLIFFVLLYKMPDNMVFNVNMAFLLRYLHFSLSVVGEVGNTVSVLGMLLGALVAGMMMYRISLYRSLMLFGWLQLLSNMGYIWLAHAGNSVWVLGISFFLENFCGGLATAAFVAFLTGLCDKKYSASQYAMWSVIMSLPRIALGPLVALLIKSIGWTSFYVISCASGIPGILALWYLYRKQYFKLDTTTDASN